jgi:hypothetical protein
MRWIPLAIAVLFFGPLWATGELGTYSFSEPRSHLVWDEAMGREPQPLDKPGGAAMLAAQVLGGGLIVAMLVAAGLVTEALAKARRSS